MRRPQSTLRLWMIAVAILGILFTLPTENIGEFIFLVVIPGLMISQLPYRARLAIEIPVLVVLLAVGASVRQSYFYAGLADEARILAKSASDSAAVSRSPTDRAIF